MGFGRRGIRLEGEFGSFGDRTERPGDPAELLLDFNHHTGDDGAYG